MPVLREPAPPGEPEHPAQPGGRAEHVDAVHADQRVERGAIDARRHPEPEVHEPRPLDALDHQEEGAEPPRPREPAHEPAPGRPARTARSARTSVQLDASRTRVFTAVSPMGSRGWPGGGQTAAPRRSWRKAIDQATEEHRLPAEEHQHAQARVRERQSLRARVRLAVPVAVMASRRSGRPPPAVRRPIAGRLAGPESRRRARARAGSVPQPGHGGRREHQEDDPGHEHHRPSGGFRRRKAAATADPGTGPEAGIAGARSGTG